MPSNQISSVEESSLLTKSLSNPKIKDTKKRKSLSKSKGKVCGKKSNKNAADKDFKKMLVK